MNVLVNTSARFASTPDGQFWAPSENLAHRYWARFLDVFDEVLVLARAFPSPEPMQGAKPASGPGVKVIALPNYCGIRQFAADYFRVRKLIRESVSQADAIYLSLPCVIGDFVSRSLLPDRPFAIGVCGDPFDALAPGSFQHPLRPFLRWWSSDRLRTLCKRACACAYVTKETLQRRYPPADGAFSTHYSSIDLLPEAIVESPPPAVKRSGPWQLISVGTFDTWYKGPDTLLRGFSYCCRHSLDVQLTFIGDGRHRADLEELAKELNVAARVRFLGQLPSSAAVRAQLDAADLFVLPSRQEGLPKALVEAMARGLPCIGTTIGGIPELLSKEDLVEPNDPEALGRRIIKVLSHPERRAAASARNLATAQQYRSDILRRRRIAFYHSLQNRTAEWMQAQSARVAANTSAA